MDECPKCKSRCVTTGHLYDDGPPIFGFFRPEGLRSFTFTLNGGVPLKSAELQSCLDCGLLWGQLAASDLRYFIEKHCTDEAQTKCGLAPDNGNGV